MSGFRGKILRDKFRTQLDFWKYLCKMSPSKAIQYKLGLLLALFGIALIVRHVAFASQGLSIGIILTLCGVLLEAVRLWCDFSGLKKHGAYELLSNPEFSISDVSKCESDVLNDSELGEYTRHQVIRNTSQPEPDYIFISHKLNEFLWNSSHKLKLNLNSKKEKKIVRLIEKYWTTLSPYLACNTAIAIREGRAFYNERKLCMGDGFKIGADKTTLEVDCSKGTYFDSFLTNIIYGKFLQCTYGESKRQYASEAFRDMKPFKDNNSTLNAFSNLLLSNDWGVSTIAITKDRRVFQLIQSRRAMVSHGLIAPSGSGSCDCDDIHEGDFRKTITYAMQRELWEEAGFKCPKHEKRQEIESFGETYIVGFFRWLKRIGKPEMLGISYIDVDYEEITPNISEVHKDAILDQRQINTIEDFKEYLGDIKDARKVDGISDHNGVSVPLLACVIALEGLLKDEKIAKEMAEVLRLDLPE